MIRHYTDSAEESSIGVTVEQTIADLPAGIKSLFDGYNYNESKSESERKNGSAKPFSMLIQVDGNGQVSNNCVIASKTSVFIISRITC